MTTNDAIKKFGYLYQRISGLLPRSVVEKIKVVIYALASPVALSTGVYAFGKSFKSFLRSSSSDSAIKALKEGLDPQSLKLLDVLLSRLLNFPESSSPPMPFIQIPMSTFTQEELEEAATWLKFQRKCFRRWKFNDYYSQPAFFYHHGLKNMPQPVLDYIRGKDFLDIGAYTGDSVLVFQEYEPGKIISFDVSSHNAKRFWRTMRQNKIPEGNVELVIAGVSDSLGKVRINDAGFSEVSLNSSGETEVDLITIDEFIRQREDSLNIALVKMDIEGFALRALKGMPEMLKRYRPVLLLAVYHNPDEFFKTKPFIESFNLNYRFAIRKLSATSLMAETYLLAWPAELGISLKIL